jgi:hypothetical protein
MLASDRLASVLLLPRPSVLRLYKMDQLANSTLAEPLDLVKLALGEYVSPLSLGR